MSTQLPEAVAAWASDPANQQGADLLRAQGAAAERERLSTEHQAALTAARAEGVAAGAAAERDRAAGVRAVGVPGFEALVETMASDGQTTPAEAAMAICSAMREQVSVAAAANKAGAPAPVPFVAAPAASEEAKDPSDIDPKVLSRRIRELQAADPSLSLLAANAQAKESLGIS
jgi:hypothetical protein